MPQTWNQWIKVFLNYMSLFFPSWIIRPTRYANTDIFLSKVLKPFTCLDTIDGTCGDNGGFIPGSEYVRVEAYTNSIQDLLNVYPSMEHLLECQLVKDAFSQVLVNHCKPMKKYARMAWVGMVFLAVIMVLVVVLWTIKAHHEHSYHLSDGSVEPHCAPPPPPNALKSRPAKEIEIWQQLKLVND